MNILTHSRNIYYSSHTQTYTRIVQASVFVCVTICVRVWVFVEKFITSAKHIGTYTQQPNQTKPNGNAFPLFSHYNTQCETHIPIFATFDFPFPLALLQLLSFNLFIIAVVCFLSSSCCIHGE